MAQRSVERRLSAILAADVAGFSRLVGADEEGTIAQLRTLRRDLLDPTISASHGRIVTSTGDGLLVEFASVVDAVRCAIEIQDLMTKSNVDIPAEKRIEFRIGINLGDIVVEGQNVLGDGVNVAARLESIADPGSIYVSVDAYRQARDKIAAEFIDLGERELKNIAHSIRVYEVRATDSGEMARPRYPVVPEKPSIAVLPFQNLSNDENQEYFTDSITEDVITALSRWHWFFVIARNSSFVYKGRTADLRQIGRELGVRYVLEGSVQKFGTRVRVTGQLIDAARGIHIWADKFDREIVDIFALQDDITEHVVNAIAPAILHSEGGRVARKNIRDLTAFDCFQRGMWHFNKMSKDGYHEALFLFRHAIKGDPELTLGYIGLARTLYAGMAYGWSAQPLSDLEAAWEAAQTAVRLDPRDAYGHFALSGASLYLARHQKALEEARKAIALNPNFAFGHFRLGQVLLYAGHPEEAIIPIERSMRHSPYDPQLGAMFALLALAHYHAGNYPEAARNAQAGTRMNSVRAWAVLAASNARLGRIDDARNAAAAFPLELQQRMTNGTVRLVPYAEASDRDHFFEGLRLAGLG